MDCNETAKRQDAAQRVLDKAQELLDTEAEYGEMMHEFRAATEGEVYSSPTVLHGHVITMLRHFLGRKTAPQPQGTRLA